VDILIVPVHLKKINWAVSFLTTLNNSRGGIPGDIEILFVCSNQVETEQFSQILLTLGLANKVRFMNAEMYAKAHFTSGAVTEALNSNARNSIVGLKKFLALHWARSRSIDFCMAIDIDVFFTPSCDLRTIFAKAKDNYSKKLLLGTQVTEAFEQTLIPAINAASASILSVDDARRLKEMGLQDIYTWFLEPPCYTLEEIGLFFDYMARVHGSVEAFLLALEWNAFEHIIFTYFRSLYCGLKIDYYNDVGIALWPEALSLEDVEMLRTAKGFDPVWVPFLSFVNAPAFATTAFPDAGMLYHFDRA